MSGKFGVTVVPAAVAAGLTASLLLVPGVAGAAAGSSAGPSSSDAPYVVRVVPGVTTRSILTAGDSVGGYRMVGIPDGLGAYDNGDGTFTLLSNHELSSTQGVPRAHGGTGAFVSKWVIDKSSLEVLSGTDQIQHLFLNVDGQYTDTSGVALNRLCSADLPAVSALYNAATGLGYAGRIFLDGEETSGGRAFGHVVDSGNSYELSAIGRAEFENVVANPATGDTTVVAATSDGGDSAIRVYTGTKQATGNPVEKAGLTSGQTLQIAVTSLPTESGATAVPSGPMPFTLAASGTAWDRPEDAAWDPSSPNDLYFVTTASMSKHSRLWHVHFTDVSNPSLGGTVEMVYEGPADLAPGAKMMDNITVNGRGQILIQEDPGNNAYLAGIWQYDITSDTIRRIAQHDPDRFLPGGASFDTIDEESSGIVWAPFLGAGQYLLDVQNHTAVTDPEIVQKGQYLLMSVPAGQSLR